MMSNWCLFTSYDDAFKRVAKLAVPAMRHYAALHNMDFAEHVNYPCPRPASWGKIYLALEKFASGYEYIFWMDADAVIRRFDENIADLTTPDADLYFAKEEVTQGYFRLNSGLWVMRNTPSTVRFLETVRSHEEYTNHAWWEQAAVIETLGLRSMFAYEEQGTDAPSEFLKKVAWLPRRWNSIAGKDHSSDPIVRHFIALDPNGKEIAMRFDALIGRLQPTRTPETEAEFLELVGLLWRTYIRPIHLRPPAKVRKPRRRFRAARTMRNFRRFIRNRPMDMR